MKPTSRSRYFTLLVGCVVGLLAGSASAAIIFVMEPGSPDFPTVLGPGFTSQASISSVAKGGVVVTVAAAGGNAGGIAGSNDGNKGFGVTGNGSFDINASESFSISFNQDVFIDRLSFDTFSFGESVNVAIPSLSVSFNATGNQAFSPVVSGISAADNANGDFTLNFDANTFELTAGDFIIVTTNSSILVDEVAVTLVPEPGTVALILGGAGILGVRRRGALPW